MPDTAVIDDISDDELATLALAADVDAPLDDDAVPFADGSACPSLGLLPLWYMPAPIAGAQRIGGWKRRVALALIVGFLLINALGLCVTYGEVVIAGS